MIPCSCAGINVTWACNSSCKHCFYKRNSNLHSVKHKPIQEIVQEMRAAHARGCNRIVLIGEGEPMLHPKIEEIILAADIIGLKSNIITNGTLPIKNYSALFKFGLNHIQISAHATGALLDEIMEHPDAGEKQGAFIDWLSENKRPFRTNTTLQQLNYKQLPDITDYLIQKGAFHVALLGFLPHYEWHDHLKDVAVHPAELRPYIEQASDLLINVGRLFTIRYHPFCHLAPKYWKYVVNSRYVLFDPWEWDYGHYNPNPLKVWLDAFPMGDSVAVQGKPCSECLMKIHCGGWNRFYTQAFDGAGLMPIVEIPEEYQPFDVTGGLHDLNPANQHKGII